MLAILQSTLRNPLAHCLRMPNKKCSFVAVLLVVTSAVITAAEEFKPERTKLVDYWTVAPGWTNFFFRGNMPVINGQFAYKTLVDVMRNISLVAGLKFPAAEFTLVDVSYLNIFEEGDLKIEEDFFKQNPDKGVFHNWVIVGSLVPPPENATTLIKDTVQEYVEKLSVDHLPKLMEFFRQLLLAKASKPVVIYGHCEAGTDRTGEVSGSYYMQFLNMTFTESLYIDNHIQGRDMMKMSRNMMQWYCFYLKFVKGYPNLKCLV